MAGRFAPRRLTALMVKETLQILRDPSSLIVAFFMPLLMLFLFGYGVSLDPNQMKMGLVQQGTGSYSQALAADYVNSPYFEVQPGRTVAEFSDEMAAGDIWGIVVIPAQFDRDVHKTGPDPLIQIITDASNPNSAQFFSGYSQGVYENWKQQMLAERGMAVAPPVSVSAQYLYNEQLASRFFLIPGSIAMILTMVGSLLTSLLIAREWERGTMETLISTPVTVVELIVSKLIPYVVLGLIASAICIFLALAVFGLPFRGSFIMLVLLLLVFLIPCLAQGLLLSALTKSQFVASQVAVILAFLPSFLLSGFIFEISSMPRWVQFITYLFPGRYVISPLQSIFLTGDVWSLLIPNMTILFLFGVFFFGMTMRVTKKNV